MSDQKNDNFPEDDMGDDFGQNLIDDRDDDILDAVEAGSEDISDYDDADEGIFAPPVEKKKSSFPMLLGTVAVLALIGGGYYFYNKTQSSGALPTVENAQTPVPESDPELSAIPQPQPIINAPQDTPDASAEPIVVSSESQPQPEPAPVTAMEAPEQSPAESAPSPEQPPVVADASAPENPEAAVSEPAAVVPVPSAPPEAKVVPLSESAPEPVKISEPAPEAQKPEVVAVAPPKQTELAPVTQPPKAEKTETVKKAVTPAAPKPQKTETVYYDAPKGKALTDIPTPGMNPSRGPNESIIVVKSKINASNQDSAVASAGRALRLGRYDAALDMYNDLYQANPRDERILMGRAVTLQKLGRPAEAIKAYEALLDLGTDNPDAVVNLMGLIRKEYPAVALEKLLSLKSRFPSNPSILAQLGVAYADAGNLEDAAKSLMQAARLEPNNPQHYFNMGVLAERMKNRNLAIAYYEKALEVDAVYGTGRGVNRDLIYDRLSRIRD